MGSVKGIQTKQQKEDARPNFRSDERSILKQGNLTILDKEQREEIYLETENNKSSGSEIFTAEVLEKPKKNSV